MFVIDNSVVCGWLIPSQATAYSESVKRALQSGHAHAPALLPMEYSNVLRTACKRGRLNAQQAQALIAVLASLPITIEPIANAAELFALALRFDLTSYDASYLALALRLQVPIASQDDALKQAAMASGVGVLQALP